MGDAAFGFDGGGFGEYQAGAAGGHLAQMHEMPVVREAVVRRVLAHRGNDDAVLQRDAAQGDRRKQQGIGCHLIPLEGTIAGGRELEKLSA